MTDLPRRIDINIAAIPLRGFGGFCVLVTAIIGLVSIPQGRWFLLGAVASGALLAIGLHRYREWRRRNAAASAKTFSG